MWSERERENLQWGLFILTSGISRLKFWGPAQANVRPVRGTCHARKTRLELTTANSRSTLYGSTRKKCVDSIGMGTGAMHGEATNATGEASQLLRKVVCDHSDLLLWQTQTPHSTLGKRWNALSLPHPVSDILTKSLAAFSTLACLRKTRCQS